MKGQLHILIVEDDPIVRTLLETWLKIEVGHSLMSAANGAVALELAQSFMPQIIITDWRMPVMNGIEVVNELSRRGSQLRCVLMTGHGLESSLNPAVLTGINAVLENTNGVITSAFNGGLEKHGHGVLTLNNVNTYTGGTTNSGGGTLMVNGQIGGFSVNSDSILGGTGTITSPIIITTNGTLAPGLTTAIGTLHASGGINLAGNVLIKVNKSVSPSNDLTQVTGALTNAGTGTITVTTNLPGATALALGDRFVIFSQAVSNGAAMTVIGSLPSGLAWSNNLATDGSISVVSGIVASPQLGVAQVGNVLTFTWSGAFKLQSQTNTLGVGLSNNWGDYPGGTSSGVTATINTANPAVFFRLSQ